VLLVLLLQDAKAQPCSQHVFAKDTVVDCSTSCISLLLSVPNIRLTSDDYVVSPIGYRPCLFNTPVTPIANLDIDDRYSDTIDLPFIFPYYGQTFTQMLVGANGVVCFDLSRSGLTCDWQLTLASAPVPIPSTNHDRALIMGPYHDIDPSDPGNNSPNLEIEVITYGTFPNRAVVVSFYDIPLFGSGSSIACRSELCTHQIVMHESGLIDVIVKDKPNCPGWNQGLAILGIQNWDRDKAVAAPGKNCTVWGSTGMNEAWRFTPSFGGSALKRIEIYDAATNTLVANVGAAIAGTTAEGIVTVPNICLNSPSTTFFIKAIYTSLVNPLLEAAVVGTMKADRTGGITVNTTVTAASCLPGSNGVITVNNSGPNLLFSLDNGPFVPVNVFNAPAGSHTVAVQDANNPGCSNAATVVVPAISPVRGSATSKNVSCNGGNDGEIRVTSVTGGNPPYTYALNNGSFGPANIFAVMAGTHTVTIRDGLGCTKDTIITITEPPVLRATALMGRASCSGQPDGYVKLTATGGTPPYQYSLNGTNFVNSDSLPAITGNYVVTVKDAKNCSFTLPVSVTLNDNMFLNIGPDKDLCEGSSFVIPTTTNDAANTQFTWTPLTDLNTATSSATPTASPGDTITYYLEAKYGPCTRRDTIKVNVLKAPKPVATAAPDGICYGASTQLQASGGAFYSWTPTRTLSDPGSASPTARPSNTTLYILEARDNYGCNFKRYDSVLVTVRPPVRVFAGNDTIAAINRPFKMFGLALNPNIPFSYEWVPSFPLNDAYIQNPIATINSDMTFVLIARTPEGCEGRDSVKVRAFKGPDIYVPSAFSPGGFNRVFRPIPVAIAKLNYFRIFNRWGQEIFYTTKLLEGWDGKYKGVEQPAGMYVWMVQGVGDDGSVITKKGTVMIVR
jgi:hypothetical protein